MIDRSLIIVIVIIASFILSSCGIKKDIQSLIELKNSDQGAVIPYKSLRWAEEMLPLNLVGPKSRREEMEPSLKETCLLWNMAAGRVLLTYSFEDYKDDSLSVSTPGGKKQYINMQNKWEKVSDDVFSTALTFFSYDQDKLEVLGSKIFFNNDYNFFYNNGDNNDSSISYEQYDFESILIHEVGHVLGMDHSDNPNSVMYPYSDAEKITRTLSAKDMAEIKEKYR
jgi:predicted small secreted protein